MAVVRPLIIVSNRAPIEYHFNEGGFLKHSQAAGGVATALTSLSDSVAVTWIASAMGPADRVIAGVNEPVPLGEHSRLRLVAVPAEAYDLFYSAFCNRLLWFVQHSLGHELQRPDLAQEAVNAWEQGYLPVNKAIAKAVAAELRRYGGRGSVMLHDYHLYAAPLFIRQLCPDARLQHFLHVPWPGLDAWRQMPRPIIEWIVVGLLLAADSVVFQTESSAREFLLSCQALLPQGEVEFEGELVTYEGKRTRVWANPMSVDARGLQTLLSSPEAQPYFERLEQDITERTIVKVDRLDPAKNIEGSLQAFDLMLHNHPEWQKRARLLLFLVPSRTNVPEYRDYAKRVFSLVDDINIRYGAPGWKPVKVFYEHNRLQSLVALSFYDVLVVNSIADGMNLVAKEGAVLNRRDGVILLSVMAGSYAELGEGALAVRPNDAKWTADALYSALEMTPEERHHRASLLRKAVLRHEFRDWLQLQLKDLDATDSANQTEQQLESR